MEWYYAKHGKQEGPVSLAALRDKFKSGEISPTDLVWKEGMAEWTAASNVPEVSAPDPSPSAPASPPTPQGESAASGGLPGLGSPSAPVPAPSSEGGGGPVVVSDAELGLPPAGSMSTPPGTPALATASLVCGILAICLVCCGLGPFVGIAAVVCGHMQMARYKRNPEDETGKGLVIAGLVTGYLAIVIGLILITVQLIGFFAELSEVTPPV